MSELTAAQIHLALNHLPVFAALFATAALLFAAVTRRAGSREFGLGLLAFAALASLPVYFTGEGAEELVEHRAGVSERIIEQHEEAAGQALATTLVAGLVAAAALAAARLRRERAGRVLAALALAGALLASTLLGVTAHRGGQIRHDEIRAATAMAGGAGAGQRDDDD